MTEVTVDDVQFKGKKDHTAQRDTSHNIPNTWRTVADNQRIARSEGKITPNSMSSCNPSNPKQKN
jgi:hypothetical protein